MAAFALAGGSEGDDAYLTVAVDGLREYHAAAASESRDHIELVLDQVEETDAVAFSTLAPRTAVGILAHWTEGRSADGSVLHRSGAQRRYLLVRTASDLASPSFRHPGLRLAPITFAPGGARG